MSIFKSQTDSDDRATTHEDDRTGDSAAEQWAAQDTGGDPHREPAADTTAPSDVAPDDQVADDQVADGHGEHRSSGLEQSNDRSSGPEQSNGSAGPGTATGETPAAAAPSGGAAEKTATASGNGDPERLVPQDRADAYSSRWESVKSGFVDEPREAVGQADTLVGELLDELQQAFTAQRKRLEDGLDADTTSTEDLRMALRRYRSFFDRLVSF